MGKGAIIAAIRKRMCDVRPVLEKENHGSRTPSKRKKTGRESPEKKCSPHPQEKRLNPLLITKKTPFPPGGEKEEALAE